ncbi:MAG TPA: DUF5989 family protein [Planctomycetaceae bacterium]|nr:DUF5989 family protein [Planctomycetaceae bacterium]
MSSSDTPQQNQSEFEHLADEPQMSLVREFGLFLRDNKKWWLTPILLVLVLATLLVALTATGVAPWIYSTF